MMTGETQEVEDRDGRTPPEVTITDVSEDGTEYEVEEGGVVRATASTYDQALSDAKTIFGVDVSVTTDSPLLDEPDESDDDEPAHTTNPFA